MAKVKALYSYTYDYEGAKISFKCGDDFQLLAKVNNDWWHVRRWINQGSQDIYIPAVYVQEVGDESESESEALYQNMADMKKQVDEFKKKESAPPPTARKPKHDRSSSEKNRAVVRQDNPLNAQPPEQRETSVADRAKKLAENFQAKMNDEEFAIPRTGSGSGSPLVMPKRSQSTKRDDGSSSPRHVRKPHDGGPVTNVLAVAAKPRSRSIISRPGDKREENSSSPTDLQRAESPAAGKSLSTPGKNKLPPPVLPKQGRPKSMVTLSPTEGPEGGDPFSSALESRLAEQIKLRSASSVGSPATTGIAGTKNGDQQKTSPPTDARPHKTTTSNPMQNGALPHDSAPAVLPSPAPSPAPSLTPLKHALPDGWTEHKTNEGHTYYYNTATGKSSWTRPPSSKKTTPITSPTHQNGDSRNPLEKVAPRGYTKEINQLSQTPIYTNSKTGERWALGKDGSGSYYYYNMANSLLKVAALPDIADMPSTTPKHPPQENIYDHIGPAVTTIAEKETPRPRTNSDPRVKPEPSIPVSPTARTQPSHSVSSGMLSAQLEVFHHSLAHMQLKKHGYLQRKRLFDAQGKRAKGGWHKVYTSLENFQLKFYTDHKVAMDAGAKPLATFHLLQATVCTHSKEKKIKHAFLVSSPFGEQFLLQAESPPQMNDWYSTIQTSVHKANEDYKLHPDNYPNLVPERDGEISPRLTTGKHGHRKGSKDIGAMEDEEELDDNESVSDKSDRIRTRLRRLMAKRPQMETLQKKGIIEDTVFSTELTKLCEKKKTQVPQFLVHFMEHIERMGLDTVGLYRLSGNAASVQKLRCLVEQDQPFDLNDPEWADINIVTGCLKLYFRELPDPIIPASNFKAFIDAAKLATTPAQRIAALVTQVRELPKFHYYTLKALIEHLRRVMDNGSVNKMHSQNVAIVFGPTLLRAEGDPFEMAKLTPVQNGIVELMLIEYDKMFTKK